MREIKFRAWDKETNTWLEGVTYTLHTSGRLIVTPPWVELTESIGLKDEHGKDIYEGDIVTCEGFGGSYKVVKEGCTFVGKHIESNMTSPIDLEMQILEIIGNIHENPELL